MKPPADSAPKPYTPPRGANKKPCLKNSPAKSAAASKTSAAIAAASGRSKSQSSSSRNQGKSSSSATSSKSQPSSPGSPRQRRGKFEKQSVAASGNPASDGVSTLTKSAATTSTSSQRDQPPQVITARMSGEQFNPIIPPAAAATVAPAPATAATVPAMAPLPARTRPNPYRRSVVTEEADADADDATAAGNNMTDETGDDYLRCRRPLPIPAVCKPSRLLNQRFNFRAHITPVETRQDVPEAILKSFKELLAILFPSCKKLGQGLVIYPWLDQKKVAADSYAIQTAKRVKNISFEKAKDLFIDRGFLKPGQDKFTFGLHLGFDCDNVPNFYKKMQEALDEHPFDIFTIAQWEKSFDLGPVPNLPTNTDLRRFEEAIEADCGVPVRCRARPINDGQRNAPAASLVRAVHVECSAFFNRIERGFVTKAVRGDYGPNSAVRAFTSLPLKLVPPYKSLNSDDSKDSFHEFKAQHKAFLDGIQSAGLPFIFAKNINKPWLHGLTLRDLLRMVVHPRTKKPLFIDVHQKGGSAYPTVTYFLNTEECPDNEAQVQNFLNGPMITLFHTLSPQFRSNTALKRKFMALFQPDAVADFHEQHWDEQLGTFRTDGDLAMQELTVAFDMTQFLADVRNNTHTWFQARDDITTIASSVHTAFTGMTLAGTEDPGGGASAFDGEDGYDTADQDEDNDSNIDAMESQDSDTPGLDEGGSASQPSEPAAGATSGGAGTGS